MPGSDGLIDRRRCGGTVWDKVDDHDWDRYAQGHVVSWPLESMWCISPTRTPVKVQSASIESLLCICANFGQTQRIRHLLNHQHLDEDDIHPAARADVFLYLKDRDALVQVLMRSPEARLYVCSLDAAHIDIELVEWAQELCHVIEAREAAAEAACNC